MTVDLRSVFADVDIATNADALTLSVSGNSNAGLVTPTLNGNSLTLAFAANRNGSATITVRATDTAGAYIEDSFVVTVTPVNDSAQSLCGQRVTVTEDGMVTIELHGSDVETAEADLTFTITSLPAEGILKRGEVEVAVDDTFSGPPMLTYEPGTAREGAGHRHVHLHGHRSGRSGRAGAVGLTSLPAKVEIQIVPSVGEGQVTLTDGIVRIGGTSQNDVILIAPTANALCLQVSINGIIVSNSTRLSDISRVPLGAGQATTVSR